MNVSAGANVGERLMAVAGERVGQVNGLTVVDLGDYRFGFPSLAKLAEAGGKLVSEGVGMVEKYKEVATYG